MMENQNTSVDPITLAFNKAKFVLESKQKTKKGEHKMKLVAIIERNLNIQKNTFRSCMGSFLIREKETRAWRKIVKECTSDLKNCDSQESPFFTKEQLDYVSPRVKHNLSLKTLFSTP